MLLTRGEKLREPQRNGPAIVHDPDDRVRADVGHIDDHAHPASLRPRGVRYVTPGHHLAEHVVLHRPVHSRTLLRSPIGHSWARPGPHH